MSILIKGMEMPTEGEAVVLVISNENGKTLAEVDEYCGAVYEPVPVPPHGRLIDADAMIEYINEAMADAQEDARTPAQKKLLSEVSIGFIHDLQDAPTVIEAEEGET